VRWFDDEKERSPFLMALEEVRRLATREGWRYQHVQAIIVAIDQYAEAATGNRDFFLNKPPSVGAKLRQGDVRRGSSPACYFLVGCLPSRIEEDCCGGNGDGEMVQPDEGLWLHSAC
jgi:hypothetical protein